MKQVAPTFIRLCASLHWLMALRSSVCYLSAWRWSRPYPPCTACWCRSQSLWGDDIAHGYRSLVGAIHHPTPSLPATIPAWRRGGAHLSHWVLYLMMLVQPLIGWAITQPGISVTLWLRDRPYPILGSQ